MFSTEDGIRPYKRSRSNVHGNDPSEAPFLNAIDFSDALDGLTDGLVTGLEDNDFADCIIPILFDGSPDSMPKLNSSPGEGAILAPALPPPALPSSPPLSAALSGLVSPSGLPTRAMTGAAGHHSTLPMGAVRAGSIGGQQLMSQGSGAFIPTPVAAVRATGSAALPKVPSSSALAPGPAPPAPGVTAPGEHRTRSGPSRPAGSGSGTAVRGRTASLGLAPARLAGSESGSGMGSGLRSGSGPSASGGPGSPKAAPRGGPVGAAVAGAAAKSGNGGAGGGRWSHSGLDDDEDECSGDGQRPTARSIERRPLGTAGAPATTATTSTTSMGAGVGSSNTRISGSSLLLRVFNGTMRPEVAALAAAAAQRALVTSPSVPPGLYFSEPEQSAAAAATTAAAAAAAKAAKRGGKDRYGQAAAPVAPTPTALPLAKYYPEADAELMAALYGRKPLPRRVRVDAITDRCHPCFRNPFEGLSGVKERKKLVYTGHLPEGALLGAYTGELRSGKLDERLVGGDLSGAEGLKAAFTLTLLDDLEVRATEPEAQAGGATTRDSLVIVGDPATCMLAEANAPRFWGSCATLKSGAVGEGDRAACNCRAYKGRVNNAAVIPCVLKVRLSRLRASAEAACGGVVTEDTAKGLEVLRLAAAGTAGAAASPLASGGVAGAACGAPAVSASNGARVGGAGGTMAPGTAAVAAADDPDKASYVYGIVTVVVTSSVLREGEEVLLRWDSDDSFFAVADQNLRQYLYIKGLTAERDAAEASANEHKRQLALLRKAHRECQAAREAAVQRRDEAVQQKEAADRSLTEAVRESDEVARERDEAVRQRDEAAEDVHSQRAAAAAVAAAAGPRVSQLEQQVEQLQHERDVLRAQLEHLQRSLPNRGSVGSALERQTSSPEGLQQPAGSGQRHTGRSAGRGGCSSGGDAMGRQQQGATVATGHPHGPLADVPQGKKRRLDEGDGGDLRPGPVRSPGNGPCTQQLTADGDDDDTATAEMLQRYGEAKQQHDAAAAALAAALEHREATQRRRAQRLESVLADRGRQLQDARREAEQAEARVLALQRELEANRLRAAQLEQQLANAAQPSLATCGSIGGGR